MALRGIHGRDLADMGERSRDWMKRAFSWHRVADAMNKLYHKLITGQRK